MKLTRTLALIAGIALLFTACNRESDEAVAIKENTNPLLEHVPADTAYVFAALEPVPKEITDAYVSRFQPVLDVLSKEVAQFQANYNADEFKGDVLAQFAAAVLDELGGSVSSASLENLGISLQGHHAIYAMGVFPFIRIGLSDSQELRSAIGRIETKMGFEMPVKTLNGTSYWRIAEGDMPLGVYIAILDKQLVISAFPIHAESRLLASFLGQEMPTQSMASSNTLAIMNHKKGYNGYGSGILDLQKLVYEVLNPESSTHSYLGPEVDFDPALLDAVCIAEAKSIVAKAPRMTAGSTKFTANEISMRYELEIEKSLATGLAALVSNTPIAADGNHLLSGSLAMQVGKLRSFVLEKANAIVAAPYQCEKLQELNRNAAELVTQLNVPMPPMVNNLMGARVRVDDMNFSGESPHGKGLVAVHVEKPEMFVGMATMMVPGFDGLDLANQSEPVSIPAEMHHVEGMDVFALVNDDAIGASIGEGYSGDLKQFMAAKPQDSGTFFSISYDMARQMELQMAVPEPWQTASAGHQSHANEFAEAFRSSYMDMLGHSRVDMSFTGDGLIIESVMTFK